MNLFLNKTRTEMKWEQVGAAMVSSAPISDFVPRVPPGQLKQFGLVSYLKDMVQAPDAVLSYMCQQAYTTHQ